MTKSIALQAVCCFLLLFLPGAGSNAQTPSSTVTEKARHWSAESGLPQLFIIDRGSGDYRLLVIGGERLVVTYRTELNSSVPVARVLEPIDGGAPCIRIYDFRHSFSRSTIWMGLEFSRDGNILRELGRTFYGSLDGVK